MAILRILSLSVCLLFPYNCGGEGCNQLRQVRLDRPGSAGQLGVCWWKRRTSEWMFVCGSSFGRINATSLCRRLGYSPHHQGHELVKFNGMLIDCLQISCSMPPHVWNNCMISYGMSQERVGVICNGSSQEMQSCTSMPQGSTVIPSHTISPTACQKTFTTIILQEYTSLFSTTESLQSSSIVELGVQDKSQSSSSESLMTRNNCAVAVVGGALAAVIGILVIVLVGLLIGWIYHKRILKSYRITEEPNDSHFINPTYDTTASPISTSLSYQQTTLMERPGTNVPRGEGDTAGQLYHVLGGPLPVERNEQTCQLFRREEDGQDYDVVSEDIVGLSYEVPIITRNKMEAEQEDYEKDNHDYSMVNEFAMGQSYEVPLQVDKVD